MSTVTLKTELSSDQLYELLLQLKPEEKEVISKRLQQAIFEEKLAKLEAVSSDVPMELDEIVAEVKAVRKGR